MTEQIEIAVTEEFDAKVGEAQLPATRRRSSMPSRTGAGPGTCSSSSRTLPEDDDERLRIRGELVELHLPLVEYLARRFRNRGEWLDDLTQVATIGLIKSIDRFDLEPGGGVLHLRHAHDRGRDQASLPRQGMGGAGAAARSRN